ncbi:unnamed protein product, partial [Menidia menidia]
MTSDVRLRPFFSTAVLDLFLRILRCRYSTLALAAALKNCSHTSSLSWESLAAMSVMRSSVSRMALSGNTESYSSSRGSGRHRFSNKVTEAINTASTRKLITGNVQSVTVETVSTRNWAYFTVSFSLRSASPIVNWNCSDSNLGETLSCESSLSTPKSVTPLSMFPIHFSISMLQIMLLTRRLRFSRVFRMFRRTTTLVPAVSSRFRLFFMKMDITNRAPKHLILFDRERATVTKIPKHPENATATAGW